MALPYTFTNGTLIKSSEMMANLNELDLRTMAQKDSLANTVLGGLTPTATGAQSVAISAGYFVNNSGEVKYYAGATLSIAAAHATNCNLSLISINSAGTTLTETVSAGTSSSIADTVLPSLPTNDVPIALVVRPPTINATTTNHIIDCRIFRGATEDTLAKFTGSGTTTAQHEQYRHAPIYLGTSIYSHFKVIISRYDASGSGSNSWTLEVRGNNVETANYDRRQRWINSSGVSGASSTTNSNGLNMDIGSEIISSGTIEFFYVNSRLCSSGTEIGTHSSGAYGIYYAESPTITPLNNLLVRLSRATTYTLVVIGVRK